MNPFALGLALVAAFLHAGWNMLVKASDDQLVAAWTVVAGAAILNLPVLVINGLPDRSVWGLIAASTAIRPRPSVDSLTCSPSWSPRRDRSVWQPCSPR